MTITAQIKWAYFNFGLIMSLILRILSLQARICSVKFGLGPSTFLVKLSSIHMLLLIPPIRIAHIPFNCFFKANPKFNSARKAQRTYFG